MIRIQGLSKIYGRGTRPVAAVQDVTLDLGPGVWGVVGPNGAGKTTLLGLILGFLQPSDGSIRIQDLSPRRYMRQHGAAYLPERFSLPAAWPLRQALLALFRLEGGGGAGRVDQVVERLGLTPYVDRPVGNLSRGLHQRVGLAQALLVDRRLVVLDEPTEGLDPLWRVHFRGIVAELRADNRTVLLASHDLAEVERLTSRVIVLKGGRVTDVLEVDPAPEAGLVYRLTVQAEPKHVRRVFANAEAIAAAGDREAGGDAPDTAMARHALTIRVDDAVELSQRLAALLELGAVVHDLTPLSETLETRVQQRLEGS